jgi:hypothetical protein
MSKSGMFSILNPAFDRVGGRDDGGDRISDRFGYPDRYDRYLYNPNDPEDSVRRFRPPFLWSF